MIQQSVTSLKSKKPGYHLIWSIMASNRSAVKIIKELLLRKWGFECEVWRSQRSL